MITPGSANPLLFSADEGYNLTRSLRFRASAGAFLNRTLGTPTNSSKFTYSTWMKRSKSGGCTLMGSYAGDADNFAALYVNAGDQILYYDESGDVAQATASTAMVFRDFSAWYHIVFSVDTSLATAADRTKLYVNGTQVVFSGSAYGQNYSTRINFAGRRMQIGATFYASSLGDYFDGYLAETHFVDGQGLTPSSFGETDTITGVWKPKRYTGTYGTNGFYLPFTDNSALTTSSNVGLGKDFSGNGNYWTTNNISITAGVTYDSMTDVPTLTSATAANFAVLNPLAAIAPMPSTTFANGNLQVTGNSPSSHAVVVASCAMPTGKWYAEFTLGTVGGPYPLVGIINQNTSPSSVTYLGSAATTYGYASDGNKYNSAAPAAYGASFTSNDVIGIAYDATTGSLSFYKNGASQGVAFSGLTGTYFIAVDAYNAGYWSANFGQRPFAYTPPTGYVALNTYNLPTSTIVKGNTVMDATLYTGTGSALSITNAAPFQPDFVWIKRRDGVANHALFDSVRGVRKVLISNATDVEVTETAGTSLTAFNSNGFSLGTNGSAASVNINGSTFVGWQWQAGQGTTSSNTNGTITSTVSVNASAGFSVVTYTGTGANATVGHGLGVAPQFIICKARGSQGTSSDWACYHASLGATNRIWLNLTNATASNIVYWNNTAPTSSVFSLGTEGTVNTNGNTNVAYCFAPIAGFSAFGSYTGNGSSDGPFSYTGFRPKYVMTKKNNAAESWAITDSSRSPYNVTAAALYANATGGDDTTPQLDFLSNGFKIRDSHTINNANGDTYIYIAFAETPTKFALAR